MNIEYEATFTDVNKLDTKKRLEKVGAKLIKKRFLQKRAVFHLPKGNEINGGWLRVRDEAGRITLSLKVVDGSEIDNQRETCLEVDNFDNAINLLESIGCKQKAFQESYRELWRVDGVDVTIDEWPFLEPYVEIEGKSEKEVRSIAKMLGFNYSKAVFGSVDVIYAKKYRISRDIVNNLTPKIVFNMKNPFLK